MSAENTRRGGRQPAQPTTKRGQELLARIQGMNLTLSEAAKKARVSFAALHNALHDDPERMSVKVVAALCGRLGLPLDLVAPSLADIRNRTSAA
jgi:transcriptional regulator with XRE-family HTH domain